MNQNSILRELQNRPAILAAQMAQREAEHEFIATMAAQHGWKVGDPADRAADLKRALAHLDEAKAVLEAAFKHD